MCGPNYRHWLPANEVDEMFQKGQCSYVQRVQMKIPSGLVPYLTNYGEKWVRKSAKAGPFKRDWYMLMQAIFALIKKFDF